MAVVTYYAFDDEVFPGEVHYQFHDRIAAIPYCNYTSILDFLDSEGSLVHEHGIRSIAYNWRVMHLDLCYMDLLYDKT